MSQALAEAEGEVPVGPVDDIETRARSMGWKPKEEYRGPPGAWRDAETFVSKGENDLPILRERLRRQEQQLADIKRGQEHATSVVLDMTERLRSADERAYKRARDRVLAEREQAVEAGDKTAFRAAEKELADLEGSAPKPAPTAPARTTEQAPAPEAVAWADRETWFKTDPVLCRAAQQIHMALNAAEPGLSLSDNLARVSSTIRRMYPAKFANEGAAPAEPEENPRRSEAASVAGSSPPRKPSPQSVEARWKALPEESRVQFERYRAMLSASKPNAKPLTREEWLETAEE